MRATIKQAENNERGLQVIFSGYGHWEVSCIYRGRRISTVTTDSIAVDNFLSEIGERDENGANRIKAGYESLCDEIIRKNKY